MEFKNRKVFLVEKEMECVLLQNKMPVDLYCSESKKEDGFIKRTTEGSIKRTSLKGE
jgi:hypothetical protein